MNSVSVLAIESHEQRYTMEWADELPKQFRAAAKAFGSGATIRVLEGSNALQTTTPGAFLNFAGTHSFKASQIDQMARMFQAGEVSEGDCFVFADAWHPGVIALRYMSELYGPRVRIIGLFHAGAYDPWDFLGRMENKEWALQFERSLFHALDKSCFATQSHIRQFQDGLEIGDSGRILQTGWPMAYLPGTLEPFIRWPKEKLVLFPHRIAPEKQPDIFRDLDGEFPDYRFVVCQDKQLSKTQYREQLGTAKLVFSASLQETLGIGLYEGLVCGAVPFAPNRLSYKELYPSEYLYPEEWTTSWAAYQAHRAELVHRLRQALADAPATPEVAEERFAAARSMADPFFRANALFAEIFR
jgi:hypothetical protein